MKLLIVVDMQNDFVNGSLGTPEAAGIVERVAEKIRGWGGEICVTQDTHGPEYLETQEGQLLPVPHCIKGTAGWRLNPVVEAALAEKERVYTYTKPTFGCRALAADLAERKEEIEAVEIIGLCTDICVLSNALLLKAFLPETPITVDAACCAGVSPRSHQNALDALRGCQVKVVNAAEG